jgi:autotransporter-associated beta strand protein
VARLLGAVRDPAGGPGRLVKLGDGVLELAGGNRWRGGTVVAGGTLLAGGARGSASGGGPVAVQAAATLGGAGTLGGPVTVERGGTVAPGATPGDAATLATTGRLALRRGAVLGIDVAPGPPDRVPDRRRARPTSCGWTAGSGSTRPRCG